MRKFRYPALAIAPAALLAVAGLCGCAARPAEAAQAPPAGLPGPALAAPARPDAATQSQTAQAGSGPARPWRYRCDGGLEFNVRFGDGAATIDATPGGSQVLLRDAGGSTPQQTVYSNDRMRVEFGLGETGREAIAREAGATDGVHCMAR